MSAVERLKIFADHQNLSIAKLERLLGVGNSTIRTALQRQSPLKEDLLVKIHNTFPQMSFWWLMFGTGSMTDPNPAPASGFMGVSEPVAEYITKGNEKMLIEYLKEDMAEKDNLIATLTKELGDLKQK